jgi:hypothetical protein
VFVAERLSEVPELSSKDRLKVEFVARFSRTRTVTGMASDSRVSSLCQPAGDLTSAEPSARIVTTRFDPASEAARNEGSISTQLAAKLTAMDQKERILFM